jgi:exodeoxyribonuclease-3
MKILTWNVNGLKSVIKNGFFNYIEHEKPDIICLQETKTNEESVSKLLEPLAEYHLECSSSKRDDNLPYSGVAILSRKKPLEVGKDFGSPSFNKEGRILVAEFPTFVLFNCYFPTGASSEKYQMMKRAFYKECAGALSRTLASGKEVILCGDFNTAREERDVADASKKKHTHGFLQEDRDDIEMLFSCGFLDAFRIKTAEVGHYTWWANAEHRAKNLGWRIDYFLISQGMRNRIKTCEQYPEVSLSDHCPVVLELSDDSTVTSKNSLGEKNRKPGQDRFCAEI